MMEAPVNTNLSRMLPLTGNLNFTQYGEFSPGDVAWTVTCSALVWLMVPGIGFFYSGMSRSKSALSLIILCCWSIAVVSVQWFFIGYSLAFSEDGSFFVGDHKYFALLNVADGPDPVTCKVPAIVFCLYQQMLAGITPALVIGATAERGRFLPTLIFMFLWTTFVYDFIAAWTWAEHGWMKTKLGVLDFAGGSPIHIAAGSAAISYAKILGVRDGVLTNYRPHNLIQVVLGTSLIWFGWFGFNGGSVYGANSRSAMVIFVTNLSASVGGMTWALSDYLKEGKFSALSFCFGAVAGLVSITPASGYIAPWCAIIFGFLGALICHWAIQLKDCIGVDDALDVAAVHGVCGLVGTVLTGIFAQKEMANLGGVIVLTDEAGWLDGNYMQVVYQLVGGVAAMVWSLVVTYLILWVMNKIPGLQLRLSEKKLKMGTDKVEMGESAYERISEFQVVETKHRPCN